MEQNHYNQNNETIADNARLQNLRVNVVCFFTQNRKHIDQVKPYGSVLVGGLVFGFIEFDSSYKSQEV